MDDGGAGGGDDDDDEGDDDGVATDDHSVVTDDGLSQLLSLPAAADSCPLPRRYQRGHLINFIGAFWLGDA